MGTRKIIDVDSTSSNFYRIIYEEDDYTGDFDSGIYVEDYDVCNLTENRVTFKRKPSYDRRGRIDDTSQDARQRQIIDAYGNFKIIYV